MKKKGQAILGLGIILVTFVAILVGVVLFQAIAQEAGSSTTLTTLTNYSLGTITNGTDYYNTDYKSFTNVIIRGNVTVAEDILSAANYTVTNNVIDPSDGSLSVGITPSTDDDWDVYGTTWRISGSAQPVTYIADSGSRAIAGLIVVFFALAVAVVSLTPTLRSGVLDMIGK